MPQVTLRPDAIIQNSGDTVIGAASHVAAVSDNSDGSYIQAQAGHNYSFHFNTFAIPVGAVVIGIRLSVRSRDWAGDNGNGWAGSLYANFGGYGANEYIPYRATANLMPMGGGFTTYTGAWLLGAFSQAQIDALTVSVVPAGPGWGWELADIWAEVDYALAPSAPSMSQPSGTYTTTRRPQVAWAHQAGSGGGPQTYYQVKFFSAAQYGAGGFNPDSSPATQDTGAVFSGASSYQPSFSLLNGTTYRAYVRTWQTVSGITQASPWSFLGFTINVPIPAPVSSSLVPAAGATVTTSRPAVGVTTTPVVDSILVTRQWDIASDASFTINKQTITETTYASSKSGTVAFPVALNRLAQGNWYIRARQIDSDGVASPYTSINSFTVAHAPTTSNRFPAGGQSVGYATTVPVTWSFSDLDPTDFQTKYEAELWKLSNPAVVKTTGQVTSGTQGATFTGLDSTWKDTELRWRVRVADQDTVWSEWSAEQAFFARDLPVVTITSPSNGGIVTNATPTITWTFSASMGRTQAAYRVVITDTTTGQIVADSGTVFSTALSWETPSPVVIIGDDFSVQVFLTDTTGLIGTDTNAFTANYAAPATPLFTVDGTLYPSDAKVHLDWSSSSKDSTFQFWRVYRRIQGDNEWELVADFVSALSYDDYLAPSDTPVEYSVVQVALSFGEPVESGYPVEDFQMVNEHYYLICPSDTSLNMKLRNVTADSFSDEQEMAHLNLIGRGRRVEYGTRYGQQGSLTAQLRNTPEITARGQRIAIEMLRNSQLKVYLRNPFGDVWAVALNSAQFTRIPGTGMHEAVDVTIEYAEISA